MQLAMQCIISLTVVTGVMWSSSLVFFMHSQSNCENDLAKAEFWLFSVILSYSNSTQSGVVGPCRHVCVSTKTLRKSVFHFDGKVKFLVLVFQISLDPIS